MFLEKSQIIEANIFKIILNYYLRNFFYKYGAFLKNDLFFDKNYDFIKIVMTVDNPTTEYPINYYYYFYH
jgi:hypothetical protein